MTIAEDIRQTNSVGAQTENVALKEWAVAIKAMDEGNQTVLVRKGGIREEHKKFTLDHSRFLLYPTYDHQRADLLQAPYVADLDTLPYPPGSLPPDVRISHFGQVTEAYEITDPEKVEALAPFYVFTTGYALERLKWMPRKPLVVLVVRTYRLATPRTFDFIKEYGGCKSWTTLVESVSLDGMTACLDDRAYADRADAIRALLLDGKGAPVEHLTFD